MNQCMGCQADWPTVDNGLSHNVVGGYAYERVACTKTQYGTLLRDMGRINLPPPTGIRVMMMPFDLGRARETLPNTLGLWRGVVNAMCGLVDDLTGIGYLTIDEALVEAGTTHRRPGLHIDGVGPYGGGGGGYAGREGMLMVASHVGCRVWDQKLTFNPGKDGDCSHLAKLLDPDKAVVLRPNRAYWCSPVAVHETIPAETDVMRQFCRISFPSEEPWHEGYTPNPLGIQPTGPIHPARTEYMGYRK